LDLKDISAKLQKNKLAPPFTVNLEGWLVAPATTSDGRQKQNVCINYKAKLIKISELVNLQSLDFTDSNPSISFCRN